MTSFVSKPLDGLGFLSGRSRHLPSGRFGIPNTLGVGSRIGDCVLRCTQLQEPLLQRSDPVTGIGEPVDERQLLPLVAFALSRDELVELPYQILLPFELHAQLEVLHLQFLQTIRVGGGGFGFVSERPTTRSMLAGAMSYLRSLSS